MHPSFLHRWANIIFLAKKQHSASEANSLHAASIRFPSLFVVCDVDYEDVAKEVIY